MNRPILLALLFVLARPPVFAEDPDDLYRQREDLAGAERAAAIWSAHAATALVTALLFLAELQLAQHKTPEARQLLQRIVDAPAEPDWAPEVPNFRRKAAERLRTPPPMVSGS